MNRREVRSNVSDWRAPIIRPPISQDAICRAAGGANPALITRAANACRRAAGRCHARAHECKQDSTARSYREDAEELEAAAKILEAWL